MDYYKKEVKNKYSERNILEYFFINGHVDRGHDRLISIRKNPHDKKESLHYNETPSFKEFEVKIQNTEVVTKERIQVVDDLKKIEFIPWFEKFEDLAAAKIGTERL